MTYGNGSVQSFGYNADARLQSLTSDLGGAANPKDLTQTFQYNPAGQISQQTRTSPANQGDPYAWTGAFNVNRNYGVNGLNQLTDATSATTSVAFGYDARGNLTSSGTDIYTYDSENRLLTGPNASSLSYDLLGRLFWASGGGTSMQYASLRQAQGNRGDQLLVAYNQNNGVYRRFVYGPGVDEPIVFYRSDQGLNAGRRFQMADERGSIISVSTNDGYLVTAYAYDEYGIPSAAPPAHGYTGQVWLAGLGMWYYKARVYSPTLGRFMQTDPIGYGDGMNWYGYVGGDPVNFMDPSGLCAKGEYDDRNTAATRIPHCVDDPNYGGGGGGSGLGGSGSTGGAFGSGGGGLSSSQSKTAQPYRGITVNGQSYSTPSIIPQFSSLFSRSSGLNTGIADEVGQILVTAPNANQTANRSSKAFTCAYSDPKGRCIYRYGIDGKSLILDPDYEDRNRVDRKNYNWCGFFTDLGLVASAGLGLIPRVGVAIGTMVGSASGAARAVCGK